MKLRNWGWGTDVAGPVALLDACVLYPAPLRDLLLRLTCAGIFSARWTDEIHEEWIRNLLHTRSDLQPERLLRTRREMNRAVPDGLITGYEPLIPTLLLPDPDDRHVLAAAMQGRVDVIVTFNCRDFPTPYVSRYRIDVKHPDDFISSQFDLAPAAVCEVVRQHRTGLRRPPKSVEQYLQTLQQQQLAETVNRLRPFAALL